MGFSSLVSRLAGAQTPKDAVDVYKELCSWLEKNSPNTEKKLEMFLMSLQKHMCSASNSVCIASLKACGYLLKHISIQLTGMYSYFLS